VLANEIFGTGSEETLIAVPDNTYTVAPANQALVTANIGTVKYTLDKGAVFGEDLSDIDKWAASNANLVFNYNTGTLVFVGGAGAPYTQNAGLNVTVDQGGAIGDNTITFRLVAGAGTATLDQVGIGGFRVKNLTSALERGVANPAVRLGTEFRNVNTTVTDTQVATTIFSSQNGVELTGVATVYSEVGGTGATERPRIDVAATELSFTGATDLQIGLDAGQDFDSTNNATYVQLGNLAIVRTTYTDALLALQNVKKENGDDFDFQGSDQPQLTITSTSPFTSYSSIYLRTSPGLCSGAATANDFTGVTAGDGLSSTISLVGQTTVDLETGYSVCAVAGGVATIPETSFAGALAVTYFNPRYTDSADTIEFGPLLRNGCQVTLFNVPNPTSEDAAFIRLTNVSELPGAVRGYMWLQDGTQADVGASLSASVAAHATVVYSTAAASLPALMPEYGATTSGRHRLVIQGAFPACEALGLIRTPSGVLTNMTSTTYAGDDSRLGTEQSNTSNTSN
jgi:hypothetical protein